MAKLVNSGVRVVVSTHSDYFVKEINSLMMLHGVSENMIEKRNTVMRKQGISIDSILDSNMVAAYLFDGGSVNEMQKSNEGIHAVTFDEVINAINDDNDEIYYSLVENSSDSEGQMSNIISVIQNCIDPAFQLTREQACWVIFEDNPSSANKKLLVNGNGVYGFSLDSTSVSKPVWKF